MSTTDLKHVEPQSWQPGTVALDIEPLRPHEEHNFATDYYEILRVGPQADEDTIERVYRTLEDRFHPDNPSTGDPETFLRLREAYETLSNPASRQNTTFCASTPEIRLACGCGAANSSILSEARKIAGWRSFVSSTARESAPTNCRGSQRSIWNA
jgi:preprotein translocase subunit Sec63